MTLETGTWIPFVVGIGVCACLGVGVYEVGYKAGLRKYDQLLAAEQSARKDADANLAVAQLQLGGAMSALAATEKRVNDVLARKTTGRACLGADAVRVLNDLLRPRPAAVQGDRVGDGPGAAATDTDVAQWINGAIARYDGCRAELAAVRNYAGER